MAYVFISYMRKNAKRVEKIRQRLDAAGVKIWIDTRDILAGTDWELATRRAIEGCSCFLACFSREFEAAEKSPMRAELTIAAQEARQRAHDRPWLIPVLLSQCAIPDHLVGPDTRLDKLHRVDLSKRWKVGLEQIVTTLQPLVPPPPIVVIGSGNGDFVLTHSTPISMGTKNFVESHQMLGGSGLNSSSRLLAAGYNAMPILSVGPDRLGEMVRDHLLKSVSGTQFEELSTAFLADEGFFAEVKTPQSTIVVDGDRRTIFAEKLSGGQHYFTHVLARLKRVLGSGDRGLAALLIGHIHTDGRFLPSGEERERKQWGECTRYLIGSFAGKAPIVLNFGKSQIDLGAGFWEAELKLASMVQLNMAEAKKFFSAVDGIRTSGDVFEWFQKRGISAALTFGKFGAAASYRDGKDGGILAWPAIERDDVVDTTGAGDAFAAGVVSSLQGKSTVSEGDFLEAIKIGRIWAGYTCLQLGACSDPPNKDELEKFARKTDNLLRQKRIRNVQIVDPYDFDRALQTFDAALGD